MKRTALLLAACLVALPLHAADNKDDAHKKSVRTDTVTTKTTVESIDHTARTVTLREKDGDMVTLYASPDVQGFDNLNVGDRVTFRYTEATAVMIHKADERDMDRDRTATPGSPGAEPRPGSPTDQPGAPGGGAGAGAASPSGSTTGSESGAPGTPAGMTGEQVTALVTVKDVDAKDQSLTFETEDGRTVSTRVDDRTLLKDVDPGDQIEITYTNALLVSVEK